MPKVFKKTYTRPVPPGATPCTARRRRRGHVVELPAVRFPGPDGRPVVAPLTAGGDRCLIASPTYYGWVGGEAVPLCANREGSETMLNGPLGRDALGKAGLADTFAAHRCRPLADHLDDFEAALRAKGDTARHVKETVAAVRALLDGCRFLLPADLDAARA